MYISWSGHYTVKISNPRLSLIINPYSPDTGLSPLRAKADIVLLSNPSEQSTSYLNSIQGDYELIDQPGEYSFANVTIYGTGWHNDASPIEQIYFRLYFNALNMLYLGSINKRPNQTTLQEIEQSNIDVLFIPIGGDTSINTSQALDIVSTLEPNIVIPINYSLPKLKHQVSPVDTFAHEMGVSPHAKTKKINISASKIDRENISTIILSP